MLSPNGQWISLKTGDGVVWLLQVENHTSIAAKVALIPCDETSVQALAFSPDSSILAVGDGNGVIRIFETITGRQIRELHEDSWVLELRFESTNILISNGNYGLSVWDVARSKRIAIVPGARCNSAGDCAYEIYDHYALSPDQSLLALAGRYISGIVVRDLAGRLTARIPALNETFSFTFRPGRASNLIVADGQGQISSWDAATGKLLNEFPASLNPYIRLAFVPGSDSSLLTFDSASANVWDCDTGKVSHGWKSVEDGRFLSPDRKWITDSAAARIEVPHISESHLLMNIRYKSYGQIVLPGN
jgi:WD40 repeat protein